MKSWFESWFDSPYYHILYQHRSDQEAEFFINNLYKELKISSSGSILDLACGKGRHSLYMARKGNLVTGVDIAPNSISEAKKTALESNLENKVEFQVMDMRSITLNKKFDYIFNLFTSFGYFDEKEDNVKVIQSIAAHQENGGIFVLDYLNSRLVRATGEVKEIKVLNTIEFHIHKYIQDHQVFKRIQVKDPSNPKDLEYSECVQLFEDGELETMLLNSGYKIVSIFGDYGLNPYTDASPRCILVGMKTD